MRLRRRHLVPLHHVRPEDFVLREPRERLLRDLRRSITSYFVADGAKLKVCSDDWFRGACDLYVGQMSIANQSARFPFSTPVPNDSISSLAVYQTSDDCQNPPAHAVTVFKDPNYTG